MSTFNAYTLNSLAYIGIAGGCEVMLSGWQSWLGFDPSFEASRMSSHTDELWYNETANHNILYFFLLYSIQVLSL